MLCSHWFIGIAGLAALRREEPLRRPRLDDVDPRFNRSTFALRRVSLQPDLSALPCTDDLARYGSYYGHALSSAFSLLLAEVYSTSTVDNC